MPPPFFGLDFQLVILFLFMKVCVLNFTSTKSVLKGLESSPQHSCGVRVTIHRWSKKSGGGRRVYPPVSHRSVLILYGYG